MHGYIGHCSVSDKLVSTWLQAWGDQCRLVKAWCDTAMQWDLHITRRLLVLSSLHHYLVTQLGARQVRQTIFQFYKCVISLFHAVLESSNAGSQLGKRCRNVYGLSDWNVLLPLPKRGTAAFCITKR